MPVINQERITDQDLFENPRVLYVFGDNDERKGLGGQAYVMRGKLNAVGVRTKHAPTRGSDAYWTDDTFPENCRKIIEDFEPIIKHLDEGGVVVFPAAGLGTGLSELPTRAPHTFDFLCQTIERVTKNYAPGKGNLK